MYLVDLQTGSFKPVLKFDLDFIHGQSIGLSRDDQTLFLFAGDKGNLHERVRLQLFNRIVALDLATGRQRSVFAFPGEPNAMPLPIEVSIALSPDGRTFAISNTHGTQNSQSSGKAVVATVSLDGTGYRELYKGADGVSFGAISWTSDGHSIVFAQGEPTRYEAAQLLRIPVGGGVPELLSLEVPSGAGQFSLSPDGTRIAYGKGGVHPTTDVYALDLSAWLKGKQ